MGDKEGAEPSPSGPPCPSQPATPLSSAVLRGPPAAHSPASSAPSSPPPAVPSAAARDPGQPAGVEAPSAFVVVQEVGARSGPQGQGVAAQLQAAGCDPTAAGIDALFAAAAALEHSGSGSSLLGAPSAAVEQQWRQWQHPSTSPAGWQLPHGGAGWPALRLASTHPRYPVGAQKQPSLPASQPSQALHHQQWQQQQMIRQQQQQQQYHQQMLQQRAALGLQQLRGLAQCTATWGLGSPHQSSSPCCSPAQAEQGGFPCEPSLDPVRGLSSAACLAGAPALD